MKATVQSDGSFDAPGFAPGTYCVLFSRTMPPFHARQPVIVVDRDIENLQLTPRPPINIAARVIREDGTNVPEGVYLFPSTPFPLDQVSARPDPATGRFQLNGIAADDYSIRLIGPSSGYVKSIRYGSRELVDFVLNTYGEASELTIEIAEARGHISGRVTGTAKSTGIIVTASPTGPRRNRQDLIRAAGVDASGTFELHGIAPGDYRVQAWETYDRELLQSPEFLERFPGPPIHVVNGSPTIVEANVIPASDVQQVKATF